MKCQEVSESQVLLVLLHVTIEILGKQSHCTISQHWAPHCNALLKTTPDATKWRCLRIQHQKYSLTKLHGLVEGTLSRIFGDVFLNIVLVVCISANPVSWLVKAHQRVFLKTFQKKPNWLQPRVRDEPKWQLHFGNFRHQPEAKGTECGGACVNLQQRLSPLSLSKFWSMWIKINGVSLNHALYSSRIMIAQDQRISKIFLASWDTWWMWEKFLSWLAIHMAEPRNST